MHLTAVFDRVGGLRSDAGGQITSHGLMTARTHPKRACRFFTLALLLLGLAATRAATESRDMPIVPRWGRFEQSFKSAATYVHPVEQTRLTVRFRGPLGDTREVDGFWDGGKVWRVRFAPNQAGVWSYVTSCSDVSDKGLDAQSGEFLCSASVGDTRFREHGPVQVAHDRRRFEHADGTPFYWLGDRVWEGARLAKPEDWDFYAHVRAEQGFDVALWAVGLGADYSGQKAASLSAGALTVNPEVFKRLDAKLERLNQAGICSAIVPLWENGASSLSDEQAEMLARYVVARWGAEPVVWLVAFTGEPLPQQVARWKKIGQKIFGESHERPVAVYPGEAAWLLDEFRKENWVDAFGLQPVTDFTEDALKWTFSGPLRGEWKREPHRPLIVQTPVENAKIGFSEKRFSAGDIRHAAYWGMFLTDGAGLTFATAGVSEWDRTPETGKADGLPLWQRSMFLPGAKQMRAIKDFFTGLPADWTPAPAGTVVAGAKDAPPSHTSLAAVSETAGTTWVYVPEERTVQLKSTALPMVPVISWLDPRTGSTSAAVAAFGPEGCQFPTPGPGDWILVIKPGR